MVLQRLVLQRFIFHCLLCLTLSVWEPKAEHVTISAWRTQLDRKPSSSSLKIAESKKLGHISEWKKWITNHGCDGQVSQRHPMCGMVLWGLYLYHHFSKITFSDWSTSQAYHKFSRCFKHNRFEFSKNPDPTQLSFKETAAQLGALGMILHFSMYCGIVSSRSSWINPKAVVWTLKCSAMLWPRKVL